MNKERKISENELVLAPNENILEEAREIATKNANDKRSTFILSYDVNQRDTLVSVLKTLDSEIVSEENEDHTMTVHMNMAQLKLVKSMDCVTKVSNFKETFFETVTTESEIDTTPKRTMTMSDDAAEEISVLSVGGNEAVSMACIDDECSSDSSCSDFDNTSFDKPKILMIDSFLVGRICCPGAEQWFVFAVPETGEYTIYTTGDLDTEGCLYDNSITLINQVDDVDCGDLNFRMIHRLIGNDVYYLCVKGAKSNTGEFRVILTDRKLVDRVEISPERIVLEGGKTYELPITPNYTYKGYNGAQRIPGLSVSIYPSNADEKKIWWGAQYGDVLKCSYGWDDDGDRYIHVTATGIGTAKLYARDWNDNGESDECTVYVGGKPVSRVELDYTSKIISLGTSERLTAKIFPLDALNTSVTWSSDDTSVAIVSGNGVVTARGIGTANITVKSVDGGFTKTCKVTVDPRPKVIIRKDDDYTDDVFFNIVFSDGTTWENIGCDMSLDENRSGKDMMLPEHHEYLFDHEKRYKYNLEQTYSADQLGFIYLFDPLGVEYYMKNDATACNDKDIPSGEFLTFKDEVYEAIFGTTEIDSGRFYFTIVDGYPVYGRYIGDDRMDVYSNAEVLFGSHTIFDWSDFWQSIGEFIFGNIPVISHIILGVEMYQALFFSGSIVGAMSGVASEYLDDYAKESNNTVLDKMLGWPKTIFNCFNALASAVAGAFVLNNLNDITIYSKIRAQNYIAVFEDFSYELSIEDVIEKCSNN